jgi:MFS family permease
MVWTATLLANVGAWMASVGTAWLMTVLDPSPIMVSLVGAATALPSFLFALPAGALADIVDRRKLLIIAQVFMLVVMLVLCLLTVAKLITPITLLLLIFVLETGSAFETPAFLAVLPELVPKRQLAPALALNGLGINISRVIGPAVGGLVISALGVSAAFAIDAAAFLAVIFAYASWRSPQHESHLPAERLTAAMRSGWRFARESPALKATLVRAGLFFLFASSYWALLPLIARDQLAGGVNAYGILFGCVGAGAVAGALVLPYVRARVSPDRLVLGGGLVTAAATAALALAQTMIVAVPIVLVTGAAWLRHVEHHGGGAGRPADMGQGARIGARPDGAQRRVDARQRHMGRGRRSARNSVGAGAVGCGPRGRQRGDAALEAAGRQPRSQPVTALARARGGGAAARRPWTGHGHGRIHRRTRKSRGLRRGACRQRPCSPPRRRDLLAPLYRHRRFAPACGGVRGRELARAHAPARARHPLGPGGRGRSPEVPRRTRSAARVAFHQRNGA